MEQFKLGTVEIGHIDRQVEKGYLLNVAGTHVLLPFENADYDISDDETMEVFIFHNRDNELQATTFIPNVQVGSYGWAKVIERIPQGVFVNIGVEKDMFISKDHLPAVESVWPQVDDQLFVTLAIDHKGKLEAIPATEHVFFDRREIATEDFLNKSFKGYVYHTGYEGSAVFSNDHYRGFIHRSERKKEPRLGEYIEGRIIDVKEDGTVNVSLLPRKHERIHDDAEAILNFVIENGGSIPISDKSDPQLIRDTFGFSKSAFKRAVGTLMRQKKVKQQDGNTILIK